MYVYVCVFVIACPSYRATTFAPPAKAQVCTCHAPLSPTPWLTPLPGGTREILWYDVRNTSAAAGSYTVDTGSGTLLPLFDADTGMMVMPSKGDGSVRWGGGGG